MSDRKLSASFEKFVVAYDDSLRDFQTAKKISDYHLDLANRAKEGLDNASKALLEECERNGVARIIREAASQDQKGCPE